MDPALQLCPSPLALEQLVQRLPASEQAHFRWAPKRIRDLCAGLLTPHVTADDIRQVALQACEIALQIARSLAEHADLGEVLTSIEVPVDKARFEQLLHFARGNVLEDAVEWTVEAVVLLTRGLVPALQSHLPRGPLSSSLEHSAPAVGAHVLMNSALGDYWSASMALYALEEAAVRKVAPSDLEELAENGYLFAASAVDRVRAEVPGLDADPDSGISPQERFRRFQRTAQLIRETFSREDFDLLDSARLRNLR